MAIANGFNRQRRLVQGGLVLAACALLSSCASFGGPRKVEVPLHKLQAGLERRFPVDHRLMELFNIRLSRPMLSVQPGADRIALALEASVSPPFARDAWTGSQAFYGRAAGRAPGPGWRPRAGGGGRAPPPPLDQLTIGAGAEVERQLTRVANSLVDTVVRDMPVYTFNPDDLRYAGVQFIPTRIETTRSGLLVTLEPAK
jgi:hypothetical protein